MKKGFSLVEVMIIFTVLSVILAASIPMISKKANPIQNKVSHGVYRCIQVNTDNGRSELVEELYSGTRQIKSGPVSKCTFKVPQAAQYKIDMYSAGTGGTKFAMVNTQRDDSRVHTYTMERGMDNSAVDPILKPNDSELAKMFNGKIAVRSAYTGDAGNGGNADLTYESLYEANCGIESSDRKVLTEEINKLKEELEKKRTLLDTLNNIVSITAGNVRYWNSSIAPDSLWLLGTARELGPNSDGYLYHHAFANLYKQDIKLEVFHGEHNEDNIECFIFNNGGSGGLIAEARSLMGLHNIKSAREAIEKGDEFKIIYNNYQEIVHWGMFYGSRCKNKYNRDLNTYYWNWDSLIEDPDFTEGRASIPRLVRIISKTLVTNGLKTSIPTEVQEYIKVSTDLALRNAELETIKTYYNSVFKDPNTEQPGMIYWRDTDGDSLGQHRGRLIARMNEATVNGYTKNDVKYPHRHKIFTVVDPTGDNYYVSGVWFKDVVDDFLNIYYNTLGLDKAKEALEKEIRELEERISELENEYKLDSYLKYNKYSKVPFTNIYSDSKLVVNSNVRTQVAEFCNMVFNNYYKLATEKRGRTIKAEDTIRFGEKRVANFGGDGGKGVYSRIKIKINYKPSKSGNTTSFADYVKNLLSVNTKGYYPVYCSDAMGRNCSPSYTAPVFSNGTDITANYKNRENKSLFEIVTQIALKGYELFSKAVTKLATLDNSRDYEDRYAQAEEVDYGPGVYRNDVDGKGTPFDPTIPKYRSCDRLVFDDYDEFVAYMDVHCTCKSPEYAMKHLEECGPKPNSSGKYVACDGTKFNSIMEYEAYTSTVVCNCTNPKYAATHPEECKKNLYDPDEPILPNPFHPDNRDITGGTSGDKRLLKTTNGTSLTYPYIGWHISGVTTPIMPIKTMPTGGERKKIYVDETNEQMQYTPVVNGEVLENMYSVYSNYIFGKNYANSIGETIPKNGSNVVMDTSSTENYKIDTASPSSVSVSPANGLDSGSINLSWQEPKLVINSTLWTKRYELGAPGQRGNSISFTATDLGKECTFQVAPRGKVYAKTGDSTKDRATMAELNALLKTSMECKNRDNKVVFSHFVDGNEYTDYMIQSPKPFEWSEKLETEIKQFTAKLAEGVQKHTWKRTSMWAKIFSKMTENNEYDLTSKGVGQAGTGTTLVDKCVARRGLYEATTYYMMRYLREDQAETKLPANGIQYTDDTVTGLRRISRIVSTSDVDKKIATERHSLQEGNQSGFNCYGVEDPSDENVSSATMVITQDSPIVQKGLMDLIIEEGGGGAVVITW